jgi:hypothetical protein
MNRDDARDRLLLAMSDAIAILLAGIHANITPAEVSAHRANIAGYQRELLKQAPWLHGSPAEHGA